MLIQPSEWVVGLLLAFSPFARATEPAATGRTGATLSPRNWEKLHALIKPDPKTSFERIPWMTSLWAARQKAAAEDKMIVLWSGDPLPLGVT